MVFNRVNFLKLSFVLFLTAVFAFLLFFNSKIPETSLVKAILPQKLIENSNIIPLSDKNSYSVNLIFEAENQEELEEFEQNVLNDVNRAHFELIEPDFSKLIEYYSSSPSNFLSTKIRKSLIEKNFDSVYQKGLEMLYNPAPVLFGDFSKDPYSLLADFLISDMKEFEREKEINGKFYGIKTLKMTQNTSLKTVRELVELQKKYDLRDKKLYLSGTPVHSYLTSRESAKNMNIICALITLFIVFLTWVYFKSFKLLLPVSLSISFGFLGGISAAKTVFHDFHIITFLFAMTLIGIGIDYSLHYIFYEKHDFSFHKNLFLSFISTALAFSLLFFLKIGILNQIALFTIVGLFFVYLFIVLVYPCFSFPEPKKIYNITFNKTIKNVFVVFSVLIIVIGALGIKFDDSLAALYTPNAQLKFSETMYNAMMKPNDANSYFLTFKGENLEDLLEKEETTGDKLTEKGISYLALSRFIPSKSRQRENFELVKKLYNANLDRFSDILTTEQINELKNEEFKTSEPNFEEMPYLKNFLLNSQTSVLMYFSPEKVEFNEDFVEQTDIQGTISGCLKEYRVNLIKTLPFVYLMILLLILAGYGRANAVKMFAPVVVSSVFTLCLLSIFGVKLNLFHILGIMLVLGFTVDYSLFGNRGDKKTKNAIFLAGLTTSVSFLLLSFTTFNLLNSLALTLFVGVISSYLFIKVFEEQEK